MAGRIAFSMEIYTTTVVEAVPASRPAITRSDFIIGGGIDIPLIKKYIRPVEFDYLLTRFGNAFTAGNNNQSNFRYQAGIQFGSSAD